jgi:1-acyl-sn-glycerol-3-phosphate acyltransferase
MTSADEVPDSHSPMVRGPLWFSLQVIIQAFFCFWLGYRATGYKRLEQQQGALILANHQSFLDPLLVGLPFRRPISFLARDSLFPVPVVGWILKKTYVLPINQQAAGTASLRGLITRLQNGWLVGIFPEGTRSETGAIGELKPGFTTIVRRAKRPIVPVGISGAFQALPMGSWFLKPARVRVVFGEPLTVEELEQYSDRGQEAALLDLVRSRIAACHEAAEAWRVSGRPPAE